jgi:hypothetical protein
MFTFSHLSSAANNSFSSYFKNKKSKDAFGEKNGTLQEPLESLMQK